MRGERLVVMGGGEVRSPSRISIGQSGGSMAATVLFSRRVQNEIPNVLGPTLKTGTEDNSRHRSWRHRVNETIRHHWPSESVLLLP